MTPRARARIQGTWDRTRETGKRTWNVAKWPAVTASIMLLMQQAVAIRGELIDQEEKRKASTVTMGLTIARINDQVRGHEARISRLERPLRAGIPQRSGAADTVAARSPGWRRVLGSVASAPVRFFRVVFLGG